MTPNPQAALSQPTRRQALWPWLIMPLAVLALFALLHTVKQSGKAGVGLDADPAAITEP